MDRLSNARSLEEVEQARRDLLAEAYEQRRLMKTNEFERSAEIGDT
ncbi:hypothetical protein [Caulobacter sp. Root655]|nr:hypothetical protein [Caulobacter sp. Root655]